MWNHNIIYGGNENIFTPVMIIFVLATWVTGQDQLVELKDTTQCMNGEAGVVNLAGSDLYLKAHSPQAELSWVHAARSLTQKAETCDRSAVYRLFRNTTGEGYQLVGTLSRRVHI